MFTSPLRGLAAAVCLLAGVLGTTTVQAKEATTEPVNVDAGFNAAERAAQLVKVSESQWLKGLVRVAVPQFSVQFVTFDSATAETSGFGAAGRARVTSSYQLSGVSEPDFQAMTEALYLEFLQALRSSGLDVLPYTQVSAAPSYARLLASGVMAPLREDTGVTVAPAGMGLYGTHRAVVSTGSKNAGPFGSLSGFASVTSAIASVGDMQALSKELGDAALLEVHMVVNFVELTNHNKGFFGRLTSTASVGAKTSPSVGSATMGVQVGANRSSLKLGQPLVLDATAFKEVREQARSTGDKVGAVAVAVLAAAIGSKDRNSSETMEAVADPALYRQVVGGGLGLVGQMFAQQLKAER